MTQYTKPGSLTTIEHFILFATSCSYPIDSKFETKIIDIDSILTPSLQRLFYCIDYQV